MIYLLNLNITYTIIFATCFDSYESSSGTDIKNYCTYYFTVFMSYSFLSNYCNRGPFLHYKTRANVYLVLGRGVVGSCSWCLLLFVFGGSNQKIYQRVKPPTPQIRTTADTKTTTNHTPP